MAEERPELSDGDAASWQGLRERISAGLSADHPQEAGIALLALAIERLAEVQASFGEAVAEQLQQRVAARLGRIIAPPRCFAAWQQDCFLVALGPVTGLDQARAAADEIRALCRDSLSHGPHGIGIAVSGAVIRIRADDSLDDQRDRVIGAARRARAEGLDRCSVVDCGSDSDRPLRPRQRTLQELEQALAAGWVQAWFMPIVELGSSNLVGYEALVRWVREDGSIQLPDTFLPLATGTQLASAIDLHIIDQGIQALAQLPEAVSVSVNLHASTLREPELVGLVAQALRDAAVEPSRLRLEITETGLLSPDAAVRSCMDQLSALGVRWLLDDFGVGFSSISHLRDLPIHGIKLDRSFAESIRRGDQKSVRLAQALAGLAEGLGLETIAEGIERDEQAQSLQQLGWACGQGWHYGKAASLQDWQRQADPFRPAPMPIPLMGSGSWALAVTENVPVGLFALRQHFDHPPVLMFVSRRLLELLQVGKGEITQDPQRLLACFHPDDAQELMRQWHHCREEQSLLQWEGRLQGDRLPGWVRVEAMPREQADGVILWQGVISDITDRKRQELHLRRVLEEAPIPIAINDLSQADPRITYLNRQFQHVFGYDLSAIPTVSRWAELAYPDPQYRQQVFTAWDAAVARAIAQQGTVESMEVVAVTAAGERLMVLFSAVVVGVELVISAVDVTACRQAERDLARVRAGKAETALAITEAIPVGTYTMVQRSEGEMGSFAFMSERFLEICGLDREQASSDPMNAFACVHPEDYDEWLRLNAETFARKLPFYGECRVVADGQVRWISAESVPRDLPGGGTVWEGVLIDITRQKQMEAEFIASNQRLQELATTDSLTGCSNRRHLEERIRSAVRDGERSGRPVCLVLCDIDHFKAINDGCGHPIGDQVLIRFVQLLRALIGDRITLGRWGGEEFILLLPDLDLDQAEGRADQWRQAIERHRFPHGAPLTASFGVAERRPAESITDWIRRLDRCLYLAKQSGRNAIHADRPSA